MNLAKQNYDAESFGGQGGYAIVASRRVGATLCSSSAWGGAARTSVDGYVPFTANTISGVGSVSKVVTAAVVLDALTSLGKPTSTS
ncbi:MAG: hypothetical protein ACHREM_27990, partial [Polyangiales bacterium]